jgi:hypothetical protein
VIRVPGENAAHSKKARQKLNAPNCDDPRQCGESMANLGT